jgi:hypothetical protein
MCAVTLSARVVAIPSPSVVFAIDARHVGASTEVEAPDSTP